MAAQSFRSALNGFNREDVVHYIESLNTKHSTALNQLKEENLALTDELNTLREAPQAEDLSPKVAELESALAAKEAECVKLAEEVAVLKAQLEEAKTNAAARLADAELEAYRRAERAERNAKARADQLYRQATGTLAQATAQVDEAAAQFRTVADRVNAQLEELQAAVEGSKNILMDAATTMYTIHLDEAE
jgi:DNA repair exonuclease SbcCD ATPase subunit